MTSLKHQNPNSPKIMLISAKFRRLVVLAGIAGLLLDVAFHWVSAIYDNSKPVAVSFGDVLRQLLIDVDPATVPLWVTLLGITAHAAFLGGFLALIFIGVVGEKVAVEKPDQHRRVHSGS